MLNSYVEDVQTLLRDSKQDMLDPGDIIKAINRARREVAMRTQCLRVLTPITGAVITASVVAGGSAYSSTPTITISSPDFPSGQGANPNGAQAVASAIVSSGSLAAVDIDYGGAGYWQPVATITDAHGAGASVTLQVSTLQQTSQGKEVYLFSDVDLSPFPGIDSIFAVQSVSLLYSNFRYSLPCVSFSTYQALARSWANNFQYVPAVCAQYGHGNAGSFYFYPVPSTNYQVELDCYCLPQDLETNQSVEAIPAPYTDAVAYWGAHLCYLFLQNFNAAQAYEQMFIRRLTTYANASNVSRAQNPYGRAIGAR